MNELTVLQHPIDQVLIYLNNLSEFPIKKDELIEIKNEHIPISIDRAFTVSTHIERLETSRKLIDDINNDEYFMKYISYSNYESLFSSLKRLNDNLLKCNNELIKALDEVKKYDKKIVRSIIFKEKKFTIYYMRNDLENYIFEYDMIGIFLDNEKVIDSLVNCFSDLLIIRDMKKNNEILDSIKSNISSVVFFENLTNKKDETNKLINYLLENKEFIESVNSHRNEFSLVISGYRETEKKLLDNANTLQSSIDKTNTALGEFKSKSEFINEKYKIIKNEENDINEAIESINEIKKVGMESYKINEFMSGKKEEIKSILTDAQDTLNIVSGASIAEYITQQEEKENAAARTWLIATGAILFLSLLLIILSFILLGFSWDAFILKALTLPILLSSLIFSMRQYIKRKNIVDSYAHKKTLALSLTGFKKQMNNSSDNENQVNYILKAIEIMTESPLNDLDKNHIKSELEALEKIRESIIENVISTINPERTNKKED